MVSEEQRREEMFDRFTMKKPMAAHFHGRQGKLLPKLIEGLVRGYGSAVFKPNTAPIVQCRPEDLLRYHGEIMDAVPRGVSFQPIMSGYLTRNTRPDELSHAYLLDEDPKGRRFILADVKRYPSQGATTNSHAGIENILDRKLWPIFERIQTLNAVHRGRRHRLVLSIHGETSRLKHGRPHPDGTLVDPYDREHIFLERQLIPFRAMFPGVPIKMCHMGDGAVCEYVAGEGGEFLGGEITPHHGLHTRTDVFEGGFDPHLHWYPVIKRAEHKGRIQGIVKKRKRWIFGADDSAGHPYKAKVGVANDDKCCGGVLYWPNSIPFYAELWLEIFGRLDRHFENFLSIFPAQFYGLSPHEETITLVRDGWYVDDVVRFGDGPEEYIVPFWYKQKEGARRRVRYQIAT